MSSRSAQEIAHDALEDLGAANIVLSQLESLLFAATKLKEHSAHSENLLDIAWCLAADAANAANCNSEEISQALDELASQNANNENVARVSAEVQP